MVKIQSVLIMMKWWIIVSEAMGCMASKRDEEYSKREHLIENEEGDREAIQVSAARQNG